MSYSGDNSGRRSQASTMSPVWCKHPWWENAPTQEIVKSQSQSPSPLTCKDFFPINNVKLTAVQKALC